MNESETLREEENKEKLEKENAELLNNEKLEKDTPELLDKVKKNDKVIKIMKETGNRSRMHSWAGVEEINTTREMVSEIVRKNGDNKRKRGRPKAKATHKLVLKAKSMIQVRVNYIDKRIKKQ
ncbi:unnamed protein product [Meganyctiphanes norvegica]|uniref:Uncharacterized protein n=1 Tax=Meganyctiphanes norvegica TaxID=48144 RepID=A0AAV2QNV0_MEGNR